MPQPMSLLGRGLHPSLWLGRSHHHSLFSGLFLLSYKQEICGSQGEQPGFALYFCPVLGLILLEGAGWDRFLRSWARPSPTRTGEWRWHEGGVNKHTEPPDSYNQVV